MVSVWKYGFKQTIFFCTFVTVNIVMLTFIYLGLKSYQKTQKLRDDSYLAEIQKLHGELAKMNTDMATLAKRPQLDPKLLSKRVSRDVRKVLISEPFLVLKPQTVPKTPL